MGRDAKSPIEIPWAGWFEVLSRVIDQLGGGRIASLAAAAAYFGTLALFPALIATFSLYALLANPETLVRQVSDLSVALPDAARNLVLSEIRNVTASPRGLSAGFVASLLTSLFVASSGVVALIDTVNFAYQEEETRGFLVLRWLAIRLALGLSLFVFLSVGSLAFLPILSAYTGLGDHLAHLIAVLRWPFLGLAVMAGLAVLYRVAPNRSPPKLRWVVPGAVLATLIWLLASLGLSIYVENFADYSKTYGALGAVAILLLWFYVSSFAIAVGASLNAALEHQTGVDTTVGADAPIGERLAVVADTLGEVTPSRPVKEVVLAIFRALVAPRRDRKRVADKPTQRTKVTLRRGWPSPCKGESAARRLRGRISRRKVANHLNSWIQSPPSRRLVLLRIDRYRPSR
jgi:membrane protein